MKLKHTAHPFIHPVQAAYHLEQSTYVESYTKATAHVTTSCAFGLPLTKCTTFEQVWLTSSLHVHASVQNPVGLRR